VSDVVVAGAGMAGLVAAARLTELGAAVELREKGDRAGGNMLLSSGVVWRHRDFAGFRADCAAGDEALQRLIWERVDEGIAWLEGLGAPVVARETGNPRTSGTRFDPSGTTTALLHAAQQRGRSPLLRAALSELPDRPVILATGGFAASPELLRMHVSPHAGDALRRCTPWSTGDGLRLGLAAGGAASAGLGEVFGRAMPAAAIAERDFVSAAQLYAQRAEIAGSDGERFTSTDWSENDVVQWLARRPGARGTFTVSDAALAERVRDRTIGDMVAAAESAGARVRRADGRVTVDVVAGISTTLGGLAVDTAARVADGVHAAGNDAGGWATGGYASGLAAALVLGLVAAESVAG
jgi:succinate dehydrogenase/fumarate reductase flavoprotein subunit